MNPAAGQHAGLRRFAGYAMAPNERGFCGPEDPALLRGYVRDGLADTGLREIATAFSGPLPYLQIIAEAADIDDVFHPTVVEAYWLGNDLLDLVDPHVCTDALLRAFAGQPTVDPRRLEATRDGASPTHAYHVLVTYPWIDLVAAGRLEAVGPMDACRIRWGTVVSAGRDRVTVRGQPMIATPGGLAMGEERVEVVRPLDRPEAPSLAPGDAVTLHYDHLCDRVDAAQVDRLRASTAQTIALVDRCLLGGRQEA